MAKRGRPKGTNSKDNKTIYITREIFNIKPILNLLLMWVGFVFLIYVPLFLSGIGLEQEELYNFFYATLMCGLVAALVLFCINLGDKTT